MKDNAWVLLFEGRVYSTDTGGDRTFQSELEDWGLEVKELLTSVVITGRSSSNAQIGLSLEHAPEDDRNLLSPHGTTPISVSATPGNLPAAIQGTPCSNVMPFFTAQPICSSSGASEEWVDVRIYAGGKKY